VSILVSLGLRTHPMRFQRGYDVTAAETALSIVCLPVYLLHVDSSSALGRPLHTRRTGFIWVSRLGCESGMTTVSTLLQALRCQSAATAVSPATKGAPPLSSVYRVESGAPLTLHAQPVLASFLFRSRHPLGVHPTMVAGWDYLSHSSLATGGRQHPSAPD